MTAPMIGELISCGISVLIGIGVTLVGFRVIGQKPGTSEAGDRWHAKYGKWFKLGGPLIVLGGIASLLLAIRADGSRPENWTRHTTADGACSIEFPQAPTHEVSREGEEADRLEVVLAERDTRYSLTFSDLAPDSDAIPLDERFALLRDIFATKRTPGGAPSRLLKESPLLDRGFPGREYQFAVGDQLVTRIKVFISGRRVYRAIAVNPPDPRLDRDAQRFLDSFRFEITKQ